MDQFQSETRLVSHPDTRKARRFVRTPLSGTVDLWINRDKTPVKARDISAGGIFLETDPRGAEGNYASVRVRIPNHGAFTVLCRVTRRVLPQGLKKGGVALEFLSLGPKERQWVEGYVERLPAARVTLH